MRRLINKLFRTAYNPKKFWDGWALDFIKDPWQKKIHKQHKWLLSKIKKENPKSILEVGCGFGRNINFLIKNGISPLIITGFDISSQMIHLAKKSIGDKSNLFVSDLLSVRIKNQSDLVFTHGVLMHVPKKDIEKALNKIIKLSKDTIILIEQNYETDNNYTFVHNYKALLSSRKVDIIEYLSDKELGLDMVYAKVR